MALFSPSIYPLSSFPSFLQFLTAEDQMAKVSVQIQD